MIDGGSGSVWARRSPLAGTRDFSSVADTGGERGVVIEERDPGLVAHVIALRGKSEAVVAALRKATGADVAPGPACASGGGGSVLWSGPGQWLVLAAHGVPIVKTLSDALGGRAAVSDQTGSRALVRASGPKVRAALAKVIALDLHPSVAPVGFCAMTELAHVPLHMWRTADEGGSPAFEFLVPRSFAGNVWHALVAAAAEYGLDARPLQVR